MSEQFQYRYNPLLLLNLQLDGESRTEEYYFSYDRENIYKFIDNYNSETSQYKYSYTPTELNISLYQKMTDGIKSPVFGDITVTYYYLNDDGNTSSELILDVKNSSSIALNLNTNHLSSLNLSYILIEGSLSGVPIVSDIFYVNWGTSEKMAKLFLNATNLMAAIDSTKLVFDDQGLRVENGGLTIYNASGEQVFYANEEGELVFSGALTVGSGSLGGWSIIPDAIISNNGIVGMHSGDRLTYLNENDPIRFWAGKTEDDYNLVITQNGNLYAHSAEIEGIIKASGGYINNDFLIGNADRGILLSGGNNLNESFISSSSFSSGALGYGWKLSEDGSAEFSNITARGKITSTVFEHDRISSIGGSLYVAPTIYIDTESFEIEAVDDQPDTYQVVWQLPYSSLTNINGRNWQINDLVKIDGEITVIDKDNNTNLLKLSNIDGTIIASEGNPVKIKISFYCNSDTYKASDLIDKKFNPGSVLILYGTNNRRHGLYLTAAVNDSPFLDVYDDSEDNEVKPAVRLGNLAGIVDGNFYGGKLSGYGLYSSNAYLRGQLVLPNAGITNQKTIGYDGTDNYFLVDETKDTSNAIRIWAGGEMPKVVVGQQVAPFIVTQDGSLYAKKGIFQGVVKATNSEFSGSIRAAGILLEEPTGVKKEVNHDHFYVAYTTLERIQLFKNSVLLNKDNFNNFIKLSNDEKINVLEECKITDVEEQTEFLNEFNKENITYEGIDNYFDNWENDHFIPSSYNYVLNIDSEGLSVWEGGLQAYSDWASGKNGKNAILPIYGYSSTNPKPQPYFMLADDGTITGTNNNIYTLNARIAASRGHFFTIAQNGEKYNTTSIVINNGIWFGNNQIDTLVDIEKAAFEKVSNNGINLDANNNIIIFNNKAVNIKTNKTVFINGSSTNISKLYDEALCVEGNIRLISTDNNSVNFGEKLSIVEAKVDNTVVGFDFIIIE